jgi:hypothetical protein
MYRRPSKKRERIMRVISYSTMTLSVLVIVSVVTFLLLGYRLDTDNGRIEQSALLQFETIPSGATVTIDGKQLGQKTSTKSSVLAGVHTFIVQKDGYETWQKTIDVKAGTLTWLDYVRLVPKSRSVHSVASYQTLYGSLGTVDGKTMLVQQLPAVPSFQVVDLRSDDIKTTTIVIPKNIYSEADTADVTHTFTVDKWDTGGRYVLIRHNYGDKKEWLVMDTRNVNATINVTTLLDVDITSAIFSGTSGNILYALISGDIRKLDLSAETISRSLVTNVKSFELFETNVITYVGTDPADPKKTVVGLYREGDNTSHVLRSVVTTDSPLHIATTHYFNQDYIAISEGKKVDIIAGNYPSPGSDNNSSLTKFASFDFVTNVDSLSFSPDGDYLSVQANNKFTSYDIEHQHATSYTLLVGKDITVGRAKWLDDDHLWTDYGGELIMREFDGTNESVINQVSMGQGVLLSQNDKYIYSIGKTSTGFQLQRVRMILP